MRRMAWALALFALVAATAARASDEHPTSLEVQEELWCTDCKTTFAEANATPYTQQALALIDSRIAAGDTKNEVKEKVSARFRGLRTMPSQTGDRPTLADLEDEVMCPVCNTTLDQSSSPAARQIERFIQTRIDAGDSKGQIKDQLVADYGPQILAAPPKEGFDLLAWLLPIGGLLIGALVLGVLAWRWSRGRAPLAAGALDPALERRVDQELARFDEG